MLFANLKLINLIPINGSYGSIIMASRKREYSKSISKLVFNIYNCFPYIILGYLFIILGIIGKFGL